jgi:thiol-disulfide isomerase/thioredoxin
MNEILHAAPGATPPRRAGRIVAAAGLMAVLYVLTGCSKPADGFKSLAHGAMGKLHPTANPAPAPTTVFADGAGKRHTLADFKGKVTLVNLWANWCAPCKVEIPGLARLQRAYSRAPFAVVEISVGKAEDETAGRAFLARYPPLTFYTEPTYTLAYAFQPPVDEMPTTILYDRKGVERARLAGGADWSSPEAKAVIDRLIAEK